MSRDPVPVPNDILRVTYIGDFTMMELLWLAVPPILLVMPALFLEEIPLVGAAILITIGILGVAVLVVKTPPGQRPFSWGLAATQFWVRDQLDANTYYLKPRNPTEKVPTYQNTVYTAEDISTETEDRSLGDVEIMENGLQTGLETAANCREALDSEEFHRQSSDNTDDESSTTQDTDVESGWFSKPTLAFLDFRQEGDQE